jgi:hypothetical protein
MDALALHRRRREPDPASREQGRVQRGAGAMTKPRRPAKNAKAAFTGAYRDIFDVKRKGPLVLRDGTSIE